MKYQVIYKDGSYTIYKTENYKSFNLFCEKFFAVVCQFPYEVEQIRQLNGMTSGSVDIIDFDNINA